MEGALESRAVARRGGRGRARTNVEAAGVLRGVITGPRASKGGGGQNAKPQTRPTLVSPSSTRPGPIYPKAVLDFGAPRSRNAIPFRLLICLLFFGFFCSQAHSSRGRCECLNRARASPRLVALIPEAPKPRIQFGGRGPVPLRKAQNFRPETHRQRAGGVVEIEPAGAARVGVCDKMVLLLDGKAACACVFCVERSSRLSNPLCNKNGRGRYAVCPSPGK